ncbi:MAG: hypothetical protein HY537_08135 [Deltaproteobacteria bacterium]|nr:hypothetical protein [Deltaproteobacteria bacterium]
MIIKAYDSLLAIIFVGMMVFGASTFYNCVKRAALTQVARGLSPMTPFQRAISQKIYDWER